MSRRIDVEPDDVDQLGDETEVARALESAQAVRLQFVRAARCAVPSPARYR